MAPLRAGGGTRLKIMEALDVGRPVVATSVGCEGMDDLMGRGVVVADTARALAEAIADLLLDPARAAALGRAGHEAVGGRPHLGRRLGAVARGGALVLIVLIPLVGIVLIGVVVAIVKLFVRWEREGKEQLVPLVLLGMLVVEGTIYTDPNVIPRSIFHPGSGSTQLRLPEIYITLALIARLIARGGRSGSGCRPACGWPSPPGCSSALIEGKLYHNPFSQDIYEAKDIFYITGAYALAAGVPIRKYFDSGAICSSWGRCASSAPPCSTS